MFLKSLLQNGRLKVTPPVAFSQRTVSIESAKLNKTAERHNTQRWVLFIEPLDTYILGGEENVCRCNPL